VKRIIFLSSFALAARAGAVVTIIDPGQGIFDFTGTGSGLSGVTYLGGNDYLAVSDSVGGSNAYPLTIDLNGDGTIVSASLTGALDLAAGADNEGIAFSSSRGTVFVSDEGDHPDGGHIREFSMTTGEVLNTLSIPPVLLNDRSSLGFEALTLGAGEIWTVNEGTLEHETASGMLRLQRFSEATLAAGPQFAYHVDLGAGAPDLVALPDGNLLVLERRMPGVTFRNRVFLVDFTGATDVREIDDLDDGGFTPVTKTLLWEQDMGSTSTHNFEGLALARMGTANRYSVVLIADNNSGTQQHLYPLIVESVVPEPSAATLLVFGALGLSACRRRQTLLGA
jgi:hypothetical protein